MVCTGRSTSVAVKRWDGQCEMGIIRFNGKVMRILLAKDG